MRSRVLAALAAVALLGGACSSGNAPPGPQDGAQGGSGGTNGPTGTRAGAPATGTGGTPGSAGNGSGATTRPGTSGTPGGGAGGTPVGANPPAPGAYTYKLVSKTEAGEVVTAGTLSLRIDPAQTVGNGRRQVQAFTQEGGRPHEFQYLWRAQSIVVEREAEGSFDCTFSPAVTTLLLPPKVGATWSTFTTCPSGQQPPRTYQGKVVRAEERTVAGEQVQTFVIRKRIIEGDALYDEQVQWFAPTYGLVVRIEREGNGVLTTQQIQNLRPEA